MISTIILFIIICILAVYSVTMTAVANVRGSEIESRKKSFDSLARSIDIRGREISEAYSRITELESAANAATQSLMECFEVRDDRPNSIAHKSTPEN